MKLAKEQIQYLNEKNKLLSIFLVRNKYFSIYGVRKLGKVDINNLIISKMHMDKLNWDITTQIEVVTASENNKAKAQKELLKSTQDKKKYEKLREKHLKAHDKEVIRDETNELDEFGARKNNMHFLNAEY